MIEFAALDYFAILVGGVAGGALGAAWYSPALLGNAWLAEIGKSLDEVEPDPVALIGSLLSCLVAATAVEILTTGLGVTTLAGGVGVGLLLGLGVVGMTMLSDALFSGWSAKLYAIQLGYRATYLVIMGAVCGAWPS